MTTGSGVSSGCCVARRSWRLTSGGRTGAIDAISPTIGDIHRVSNAFDDRVTISIHVYGADIGKVRRSTYDQDGSRKTFVSGYAEAPPLSLRDD